MLLLAPLVALALGATASPAATARPVVVDDCESAAPWKATPADGVSLSIGADAGAVGKALRLDFDFHGGGGYAVAHRAVSLDLPANYRFTFRLKGECRPNNLEFKLIDASGENVWWCNQRDLEFSPDWKTVTIKQRQVSFAWGPRGGGEPGHIAAIEFAVTAGKGGKGTVWIDDLQLQALPPPGTGDAPIVASASSASRDAALALDGDSTTAWAPSRGDRDPWLRLDFGADRDFGGLVLDWAPGRHAMDYVMELSADGKLWLERHTVRGGNGGRDYLFMPESEARFLRLRVLRAGAQASAAGVALAAISVKPLEWAGSRDQFYSAIAAEAPRGSYPRALLGEMIYWTVVGIDNDSAEGLFDEYGRVETGKGAFTVEPFLRDRGRLVSWNDAQVTQSLREGYLPVPVAEWAYEDMRLTVTAFGIGTPDHSAMLVRYRLRNTGAQARRDTLYLALRPFQVNPPSQFLNTPGGFAPIPELAWDDRVVRAGASRGVVSLTTPENFGAAAFAQGDIVDYLRAGILPRAARMTDPGGVCSGAFQYTLDVPAGGAREVVLLIPLHEPPLPPGFPGDDVTVARYADDLQRACETKWKARQNRVTIQLPDSAAVHALKAQLAWVLINRNGPAIQPGTRSYARSWIRDGSLTSSALLRLGESQAVREFIEWFVPHQYANGKAPCCVDSRGADPVPEHDSSGELIYLITEYYRYTGDREFAERMWPHVLSAAGYLDTLRAQRRTPEYRAVGQEPFFGLLPPSISHEGYSAKPMHSYWDDFWALRGFKDAAFMAGVLGKDERASLERDRDEFEHDLVASLQAAMKAKDIDYLPGCADLGDFDPTSTSIGLSPADAAGVLPKGALERTYEKYWEFFTARETGREPWENYTPYEWRNVGAMVRLGWRDRAHEALQWFMNNRRPKGFQHWAEVVWRDERLPRFIGDMPHTWCGTDYVRSVLDMLAYEREADSSLVIGAGVTEAWLDGGVVVRDLHTRWGTVSFSLRRQSGPGQAPRLFATVESNDMRVPRGGIVLALPVAWARSVQVDGQRRAVTADGSVVVHALPAEVSWWPDAPPAPAAPRAKHGRAKGARR